MSITIKEIAKIAGVARATVDRALKGRDNIKPETRAAILEIVKKYDYKPNTIGKALVYTNKKYVIGVILNSVGNDFFEKILSGIKRATEEITDYGFELKCEYLKGYSVDEQLNAISVMQASGVKSLVITPINDKKIIDNLNQIAEEKINVITVNSDIENVKKLCYVGCDYYKSGRTAGSLVRLSSSGNTNLLIVTGSLVMKGHKDRVQGVQDAISSDYPLIKVANVIENNDDELESYVNVLNKLNENSDINFICVTAGGVKGACRAASECGRKISVVSFDDTEVIKALIRDEKIIATITQQPFEQGYNAIKAVFNYVINKTIPKENLFTELNIKMKENI